MATTPPAGKKPAPKKTTPAAKPTAKAPAGKARAPAAKPAAKAPPAPKAKPATKPAAPAKRPAASAKAPVGKTQAKTAAKPAPAVKTKPQAKPKAALKPKTAAKDSQKPAEAIDQLPEGDDIIQAQEQPEDKLAPRVRSFCEQYLIDLNGTQAAIRAGYSPATANEQAARMLANVSVRAYVDKLRAAQQKRTGITADLVLQRAWDIFNADAREIVEVRKGCCRYCYGIGHEFQYTMAEMNRELQKWNDAGNDPLDFDMKGGTGYTPHNPPRNECPECWGDGMTRTVLKDSRFLSTGAAALYAGAKHGKHGIEVNMMSQEAILEKLFKHTGLYELDNKQKTPATALGELATKSIMTLQEQVAHAIALKQAAAKGGKQ